MAPLKLVLILHACHFWLKRSRGRKGCEIAPETTRRKNIRKRKCEKWPDGELEEYHSPTSLTSLSFRIISPGISRTDAPPKSQKLMQWTASQWNESSFWNLSSAQNPKPNMGFCGAHCQLGGSRGSLVSAFLSTNVRTYARYLLGKGLKKNWKKLKMHAGNLPSWLGSLCYMLAS